MIIIGAGASGLSAGEFLLEKGFEVEILEGSNVLGGRVGRLEDFADFPLEKGGEELYNKGGLYYTICEKVGARII